MRFKSLITKTIAAVLCMAAFSLPVSANVSSDTSEELAVNDSVESKTPLTPSGNLTTVDDVHQVSDEDTIEDKQFITVQSKNGNTFYIIIDRSGDTENVYFLNAVDEADLMALMEDEQKEQLTAAVCTCTTKCELGSVNAECEVCSENKDSCTAAAATQAPEKQEPAEKTEKSSASFIFLILFALAGAGGAFYWFKIRNKKSSTKGDTDPNDLFEEDEDYEIEETEVETETETDYEPENEDEEDIKE